MKKAAALWILILCVFPLFAENTGSGIIKKAESLIGTPYRYGGTTPEGFDCSGFITYLYKKCVPSLPRISRDMARSGRRISRSQLAPGDLVFFATGTSRNVITHVALFIGNNFIIHAVSGGPETGVIKTNLNTRYWSRRYAGAARVLRKPLPAVPLASKKPEVKSPWNTFNGFLEGDFNLYRKNEQDAFEKWKKDN